MNAIQPDKPDDFPERFLLDKIQNSSPNGDKIGSAKAVLKNGEKHEASQVSPPATTTLLIVEDNPDLREYLAGLLSEHYNVMTAENGKVALEKLNFQPAPSKVEGESTFSSPFGEDREEIDLIISDVMMPVMDGLELLRNLKSGEHLRSLPVIMLTARAGMEDKLNALRIGVDDYLVKPFVEEELLARIANLLENYRNRQQFAQDVEKDDTPTMPEVDARWLEEFEAMVKKELPNANLTVTWMAGLATLSQRQLARRLQQLTGLTSHKYLVELRMNKARKFLEDGRYRTVSEVAYAVGFDSPRSFSRAYQARFGCLPSAHV